MAAKTFRMYATITGWVDGDTCHAILDQGFNTFRGSAKDPQRCRIVRINAPELGDERGTAARQKALELAPPGEYEVVSYRPDKYGRPLIDVVLRGGGSFADAMLAAGQASPTSYQQVSLHRAALV